MKVSIGNLSFLSFEDLSSFFLPLLFCIVGYNKKLYAESKEGNALIK